MEIAEVSRMSMFDVEPNHIERLEPEQLVRLLRQLLYLEAERHGIPRSATNVPLQISVPDGGEDGRIQWEGGPDHTDFVPNRFTVFQSKATGMGPADCKKELLTRTQDSLKTQVEKVLDEGGAYVFFCRQSYVQEDIEQRIAEARQGLKDLGRGDWQSAHLEFHDGNKIVAWVNRFFPAEVYVFECNGIALPLGIKSWWNWASHRDFQVRYVSNPRLADLMGAIRTSCYKENCPPLRITGLSGLGKTRLTLEAFRPIGGSDQYHDNALHQRMAYVDAASLENQNVVGVLSQIVKLDRSGILVVDNCEPLLHRQLVKELGYKGGEKISLVTLDFEPDEGSPEWRPIPLKPGDCEGVARGIVADSFPGIGQHEISRIEEFSQGFASIAVLIARQIEGGFEDFGRISDEEIIRRLVTGRDQQDRTTLSIVTACSLFEHFEFSDETITDHIAFMAQSIACVTPDTFYAVCTKILERGILQRRGRFARVCPIPLAITLAARWIDQKPGDQLVGLVGSLKEHRLFEQFYSQLSKLSFCKNANQLVTNLIGPNGPFGNPEALLTEEGSRLFRALVEVNPQMTTETLWRILKGKSHEEILDIRDDVRRNLIWSLKNLCWWADTFARAARMMLSLAAAENEAWGNNATGEFLGLFHVHLPGTEADLAARLTVIREALVSANSETHILGIRALGGALETESFSRAGGPEAQGSRAPRHDYYPKGEEAREYWADCISLLVEEIIGSGQNVELARGELARRMRSLLGCGMIQEVESAVRAIVETRGKYWPEALVAIRGCLDHDLKDLPAEWHPRIAQLEKLLLPEGIEERLRLHVSTPGWRHVKDELGHYTDINIPQAQALADELGPQGHAWYDKLPILFDGVQQKGYFFGFRLAQVTADPEAFVKKAMECLRQVPVEHADPSVLGGFLDALSHNALVVRSLDEMASDDRLLPHIVAVTTLITPQEQDLNRLVGLAQAGRLKASDLLALKYGDAIGNIDSACVMKSCLLISTLGMDYAWCALEIVYMYCFARKDRLDKCHVTLREILMYNGLLSAKDVGQRDIHDWQSAAEMVLSHGRDEQFAMHLVAEIVQACSAPDIADIGFEHTMEETLSVLLRDYLVQVWPLIGDALLSKDWRISFHVRHMMGMTHEKEEGDCGFSRMPREFLMQWCENNKPEAPAIVAELMPVFAAKAAKVSWHPLAQSVIDRFGDMESVRRAIYMNLINFMSWGSRVPYCRRRLELVESLFDHSSRDVREWAKAMATALLAEIRKEAIEDEEEEFGLL
jgi:hypothetical protein